MILKAPNTDRSARRAYAHGRGDGWQLSRLAQSGVSKIRDDPTFNRRKRRGMRVARRADLRRILSEYGLDNDSDPCKDP